MLLNIAFPSICLWLILSFHYYHNNSEQLSSGLLYQQMHPIMFLRLIMKRQCNIDYCRN